MCQYENLLQFPNMHIKAPTTTESKLNKASHHSKELELGV